MLPGAGVCGGGGGGGSGGCGGGGGVRVGVVVAVAVARSSVSWPQQFSSPLLRRSRFLEQSPKQLRAGEPRGAAAGHLWAPVTCRAAPPRPRRHGPFGRNGLDAPAHVRGDAWATTEAHQDVRRCEGCANGLQASGTREAGGVSPHALRRGKSASSRCFVRPAKSRTLLTSSPARPVAVQLRRAPWPSGHPYKACSRPGRFLAACASRRCSRSTKHATIWNMATP